MESQKWQPITFAAFCLLEASHWIWPTHRERCLHKDVNTGRGRIIGIHFRNCLHTLILQMQKIQSQRGLVPSPRLSRTLLGQDTNTEQLPFLITEHINKITLNNILKEFFSVFIFGCAGS